MHSHSTIHQINYVHYHALFTEKSAFSYVHKNKVDTPKIDRYKHPRNWQKFRFAMEELSHSSRSRSFPRELPLFTKDFRHFDSFSPQRYYFHESPVGRAQKPFIFIRLRNNTVLEIKHCAMAMSIIDCPR